MNARLVVVSLLLCGLFTGAEPGRAQEPGTIGKDPLMQSPENIPEMQGGFVVVAEDDIQVIVEGIESDFRKALDENAAGHIGSAARELRKAAATLRLGASRAPHADRAPLLAASDSVEAQAALMKGNRAADVRDISQVAGLAHHALAEQLLRLADDDWGKNDAVTAGGELGAALSHFAAAADWLKGGVPPATVEKFDEWQHLAEVLQQGQAGWTQDRVRAAIRGLRAELGKL